MDLAAALAQTGTRKGPQCSVCQLVENPPEGITPEELQAALASDVTQAHLARALHVVTGDTAWISRGQAIGRHRAQHS
jgi:hypothetical protein